MSKKKNSDSVVSKDVVVQNQLGLHARPASMFVKTATKFASEIMVEKEGESVNGKSIMGLMMLGAAPGTTIELVVEGRQAKAAVQAVARLVESRFGED